MNRIIIGIVATVWGATAALAASPEPVKSTPPAGLSQEQFDALVGAISDAVVARLKEQGSAPGKAVSPGPEPAAPAENEDAASKVAGEVAKGAERVMLALPALPGALLAIVPALDRSAEGGHGALVFLLMLGIAAAATLSVEPMARRALSGLRGRLAAGARPEEGRHGLWHVLVLALLDLSALAGAGLVAYGFAGAWFSDASPQSRFGTLVLTGLFAWRMYLLAFKVVLRPILASARLVPLDDGEARLVFRSISVAVATAVALRVVLHMLIAMHVPREIVASGQVVANILILAVFVRACIRSGPAVGRWFESLGGEPGRDTVGAAIARGWLAIAIPFFSVLVVAQIYGALTNRPAVPVAMLFTVNTAVALLLAETVLGVVVGRLGGAASVAQGGPVTIRVADVVVRCVRVAILILAAVSVAQTWAVDVIGAFDQRQWHDLTRASLRAGATLFIAYAAYEVLRLVTHRYVTQGGGRREEDEAQVASTRIATLMPLLRIALTVVIVTIALLIVLSEMGVNITPLIAGASVLGLAVSFGSQTLVRDIVSGVFYLADDAFRVGEYIDCGKAKGTVEGFTLRSIRLRHQNGQIHTIPFGQLGQITNFSRDWTTVKFNLKLARDTDIEKVRKIVKKLGQAMLEEPELKEEFLEPLKMQGLADIAENALILRFKFTVRPGKPTFVQREAVKRIVRAFQENGIAFASPTVAVQTLPGVAADPAAAAAAAAQAQIERMQAAAAATQGA